MILYSSSFLQTYIEIEKSLLIERWLCSPPTIKDFKYEMLKMIKIYGKHKPKYHLWLMHNFELKLDTETNYWIEQNINIPGKQMGNLKTAFVVNSNFAPNLDVLEVFDETKSDVVVKFFTTEEAARNWLLLSDDNNGEPNQLKLKINSEKRKITIDITNEDITDLLRKLKVLKESDTSQTINSELIKRLTKTEKIICQLVLKGLTSQKIASILNISENTVKTHRKNINKKMGTSSILELLDKLKG